MVETIPLKVRLILDTQELKQTLSMGIAKPSQAATYHEEKQKNESMLKDIGHFLGRLMDNMGLRQIKNIVSIMQEGIELIKKMGKADALSGVLGLIIKIIPALATALPFLIGMLANFLPVIVAILAGFAIKWIFENKDKILEFIGGLLGQAINFVKDVIAKVPGLTELMEMMTSLLKNVGQFINTVTFGVFGEDNVFSKAKKLLADYVTDLNAALIKQAQLTASASGAYVSSTGAIYNIPQGQSAMPGTQPSQHWTIPTLTPQEMAAISGKIGGTPSMYNATTGQYVVKGGYVQGTPIWTSQYDTGKKTTEGEG